MNTILNTEMKTCYYISKDEYGSLSILEGFVLIDTEQNSQVEIIRSAQQLLPLIHDFINKKFVFDEQISAVHMLERIRKDEIEYHY